MMALLMAGAKKHKWQVGVMEPAALGDCDSAEPWRLTNGIVRQLLTESVVLALQVVRRQCRFSG